MNEEIRHALIDTEETLDKVVAKLVALQTLFNEPSNNYLGVSFILGDAVTELLATPVMQGDFKYDIGKESQL